MWIAAVVLAVFAVAYVDVNAGGGAKALADSAVIGEVCRDALMAKPEVADANDLSKLKVRMGTTTFRGDTAVREGTVARAEQTQSPTRVGAAPGSQATGVQYETVYQWTCELTRAGEDGQGWRVDAVNVAPYTGEETATRPSARLTSPSGS